ncbi:MAG: hypothetical protein AAF497_26005, partial [Planctomycetota bacterium]
GRKRELLIAGLRFVNDEPQAIANAAWLLEQSSPDDPAPTVPLLMTAIAEDKLTIDQVRHLSSAYRTASNHETAQCVDRAAATKVARTLGDLRTQHKELGFVTGGAAEWLFGIPKGTVALGDVKTLQQLIRFVRREDQHNQRNLRILVDSKTGEIKWSRRSVELVNKARTATGNLADFSLDVIIDTLVDSAAQVAEGRVDKALSNEHTLIGSAAKAATGKLVNFAASSVLYQMRVLNGSCRKFDYAMTHPGDQISLRHVLPAMENYVKIAKEKLDRQLLNPAISERTTPVREAGYTTAVKDSEILKERFKSAVTDIRAFAETCHTRHMTNRAKRHFTENKMLARLCFKFHKLSDKWDQKNVALGRKRFWLVGARRGGAKDHFEALESLRKTTTESMSLLNARDAHGTRPFDFRDLSKQVAFTERHKSTDNKSLSDIESQDLQRFLVNTVDQCQSHMKSLVDGAREIKSDNNANIQDKTELWTSELKEVTRLRRAIQKNLFESSVLFSDSSDAGARTSIKKLATMNPGDANYSDMLKQVQQSLYHKHDLRTIVTTLEHVYATELMLRDLVAGASPDPLERLKTNECEGMDWEPKRETYLRRAHNA